MKPKKKRKPDKHYVMGELYGIIAACKIIKPEVVPALEMLADDLKILLKLYDGVPGETDQASEVEKTKENK